MPHLRRVAVVLISIVVGLVRADPPPLASTPDPFAGTWSGTVTAPNGTTDIGFAFTPGKRGLNSSLTMPDMFVNGMPLGPAHIVDDTYTFPPLNVRLARAGDKITGTFANPLLRVELHRSDHLPSALPTPSLPVGPLPAWSHYLGAQTWASPVARDGVVYVGATDGRFHALNAADGRELWAWSGANPLYGEALATADRVYFLDDHSDLICLDRANGHLSWHVTLHDEKLAGHPVPANETFNRRVPVPVIKEQTLYIGSTDHGLYAVDASSGKILWRHDTGAAIYASVAVDDELLVVGCFDGSVLKLNRRDGAELQRTKLGGPVASAPVIAGDRVIVGCRDYLLYGLRKSDLGVAWRDSYWFSWVESVPRLVDGILYIGGSDYRRISALDPASGAALWVAEVGGITWGTPVVTADMVFAGTSSQNPAAIQHVGGITALDRKTGAVKWRHVTPLPAGVERAGYLGSLVVVDGKLIGAGFDGVVIAYPVR